MYNWDDIPEPDYETYEPEGAYINGKWVAEDELPIGYGHSPDWWDDDGFGETFEEYMEHTD